MNSATSKLCFSTILSCCELPMHAGGHDNIVALRGLSQHKDDLYLVMEYCPRGTLDMMLHHSAATRWDAAKLLSMVRSIARGMLHLHTRKPPMLHRDLKPGNIFVGEASSELSLLARRKPDRFSYSNSKILKPKALTRFPCTCVNLMRAYVHCQPEILSPLFPLCLH